VPLDRFAEPRGGKGAGSAWFRLADDQPAFFAGIWVSQWSSIRKLKDGETTDDLYAFLTCEPNTEVGAIHPKAMPVILTEPGEWTQWLTSDWSEAKQLQRPLADGMLAEHRSSCVRLWPRTQVATPEGGDCARYAQKLVTPDQAAF
jgi:putative SOS response-associated peptidase YedK